MRQSAGMQSMLQGRQSKSWPSRDSRISNWALHTAPELNVSIPKDVGPAGIGLLYFDVGDSCKFCFVIVDANNSKPRLQGRSVQRF